MTSVLPAVAQEKEQAKTVACSSGRARANDVAATGNKHLQYRVAFLGSPPNLKVEWNEENLGRPQALGFNTAQHRLGLSSEGRTVESRGYHRCAEGLLGATAMLGDQSPERRAQRHSGCPRRPQEQ